MIDTSSHIVSLSLTLHNSHSRVFIIIRVIVIVIHHEHISVANTVTWGLRLLWGLLLCMHYQRNEIWTRTPLLTSPGRWGRGLEREATMNTLAALMIAATTSGAREEIDQFWWGRRVV